MNDNKPLVSVIMSEYNTDVELLYESIQSILKQTYKNFEFIIIDDCGKNDVESIINSFNDKRIKLYKNKINYGLVYSLNKAISLSRGKYIARMDTDDYSYPNRIEVEVNYLEKHPDIDIIGARCDYYDGTEIWGESKWYGKITKNVIIKGNQLIHPTVMYRKEKINLIGGYLNYNRCEDTATWIEMFVNGCQMYVINDKLIRYHLGLQDYKKRSLKNRKNSYRVIKEQYSKLNISNIQKLNKYIKLTISSIIPHKIMYKYHKRKLKQN